MAFERSARRFPTTLFFCVCLALLLAQQGGRALAQPTDALRFFNNFFVTGDYVVGGVGLWQDGSDTINMILPPEADGAEPLAAFLYWQVVTSADPNAVDVNAGATFNGLPLKAPLGTQLLPTSRGVEVGTAACQLNGGASNTVHTFRSDVLRFLDVDVETGRRVIEKEGGYPVVFPSGGATTLGASLVVIYRHPDPDWPLNAIVMYDGTFVKQQPGTLMQRIEGFYDSKDGVEGQITYIAGSAQSNLGEVLTVDTDDSIGSLPSLSEPNPFDGALGNGWDNVTRPTAALTGPALAGGYLDTAIAPQTTAWWGFLVNDCIAMGAMIYRTEVNDFDLDGLLDRWEDEDVTTLLDPNGVALPNLRAMGANENNRDIFIEIGAMTAPAGTTYGSEFAPLSTTLDSVTDGVGHNHLPTPAVLRMLGEAFAAKFINLHFDVGSPSAYHALLVPGLPEGEVSPYASLEADPYLVGLADETLARGGVGELINETACVPDPEATPEVGCQFPEYPGTVRWKSGFQLYKQQRFDANRKDSFRYALYAHAKGSPKSLLPCLDSGGAGPVFTAAGDCVNGGNELYHVPAGVSGSGEYPGGDFLVTLGLWDNINFVGSDFGVASTTMHELGHTLDLGHGGAPLPNCKPNYLSVMNYLFQLGGLVDADGVPHLGYSELPLQEIVETGVNDGYELPGPYRTSWYAPLPEGDTRTPAKRFCNGLKFDPLFPPVDTIRIDGSVDSSQPSKIDWNADGDLDDVNLPQDVNFDGEPDAADGGPTTTLEGYDDWTNLRLNQVGSRRNFAGISIGPLGVRLLGDGAVLLGDGSVLLSDGSVLLGDGTHFLGDGTVWLADGSVFLGDGSVFLGDGSVLLGDGSPLLGDGAVWLSDGSVFLSDGKPLLADGSVLLGDGVVLLGDGSVFLGDGLQFLGDGAQFLGDGSVLLGDGVTLLGDGSVFLSDGSPFLADGDTAWEFTESTLRVAVESGNIPGPNSLTACVIGGDGVSACLPGPPSEPLEPLHRVWLDWEAPNAGNVDHYLVYRVLGDTVTPGLEGEPAMVDGSVTFFLDDEELPNNVEFTYFVEAVLDDETVTPRSNYRTIAAENDPPVAGTELMADTYSTYLDTPLVVPAEQGVLANDAGGADSDPAALRVVAFSGATSQGTVNLLSDGSFTYTPNPTFVGTTDTFTYQANNGPWTAAPDVPLNGVGVNSGSVTVTITVLPIPITFNKTVLWLSTSSAKRLFDLKAELLKNNDVVATKELVGITLGVGTTFNKATSRDFVFPTQSSANFAATDTLRVRLSARLNIDSAGGSNASGATRFWYNIPLPAADSRVEATRGGATPVPVNYYMVTPFALQMNGSVSGPTQYVDKIVTKAGYAVLETWSITGP